MRFRLRISRLMAFIAMVALGLALSVAVVRQRGGATLALTAAILALATLGVPLRRGGSRAFCIGFAVCGWAYFAAAFWSPQVGLELPSTRYLVHLAESGLRLVPPIKGPDDIVPMIRWLHEYLRVAHALVALLSGLIGGLLAAAIGAAAGLGGIRPRHG